MSPETGINCCNVKKWILFCAMTRYHRTIGKKNILIFPMQGMTCNFHNFIR